MGWVSMGVDNNGVRIALVNFMMIGDDNIYSGLFKNLARFTIICTSVWN